MKFIYAYEDHLKKQSLPKKVLYDIQTNRMTCNFHNSLLIQIVIIKKITQKLTT